MSLFIEELASCIVCIIIVCEYTKCQIRHSTLILALKIKTFFFCVVEVSAWPVPIVVSFSFIKTDIVLLMCKLLKSEAMFAHCAIVGRSFEALPRFLI
jgi:hypothetical protein